MERNHRYEPPRHIVDFHIAGFAYYDGLDVINELSLGQPVTLMVETDNPYDSEAVAVYYKDKKIGEIIVNERLGIDSLKDAKYIDVDKKEFIYSIDKEITDILGSKNEKYKITTSIYMEKGFDLEFVIENEGKTATIKKEISVAYNE